MVSASNAAISGTSADFTISAAPGAITVSKPDGGETWTRGSAHPITWTYTGNPGTSVNIQLYKGGAYKSTIKAGAAIGSSGSGSFRWTVPVALAAGSDYKLMINCVGSPGITDMSDSNFTIN